MKLYVISLIGCPYCAATIELFNQLNINSNIKEITWEEKDDYKTDLISTFPQVYYNEKLLGGYEDINEIRLKLEKIYSSDKKNKLELMSKFLNNKYNQLERKEILRIIELFIKQ